MKKLPGILLFLSLIFTFESHIPCSEYLFGPKTYKRTKGNKNYYVDEFRVLKFPSEKCKLVVWNGEKNGKNSVSSAKIKLNGAEILKQSDFNQNVYLLERDVTLKKNNKLEVTLTSQPGSYLKIGIMTYETVIKDTTKPYLYVESPEEGLLTNNNIITVNGVSRDNSPFEVKVNGTDVEVLTDGSFSHQVSLQEGTNTITVTSVDSSANSSSITRTVSKDSTPPELFVTNPQEGLLTGITLLNLEGSASDKNLLQVKINGSEIALGQDGSFFQQIDLLEGLNRISVEAFDKAGNKSTIIRNVVLDVTPPQIIVESPEDGLLTNKILMDVLGSVIDSNSVTLKINGNQIPVGTDNRFTSLVNLIEGLNSIEFEAVDGIGNKTSVIRRIQVDTTAPVITINNPSNGFMTSQKDIDIAGLVTEENEVSLKINDIEVELSNNEFAYHSTLTEGRNIFIVKATDKAGNSSTTNLKVVLDTKEPEISLIKPAEGSVTNNPSSIVEGQIIDSTEVTLKVNENDVELNGSSFTTTLSLAEGKNTIVISAVDEAGNNSELLREVRLDTQPPVITLLEPLDGIYTQNDSVTVRGSIADSSHATLKVNGREVILNEDKTFITSLTAEEGINSIEINASDEAGNSSVINRNIIYDITLPVVQIESPADGLITNNQSPVLKGKVIDINLDKALVNGQEVAADAEGNVIKTLNLFEGKNEITLSAVDKAANSTAITHKVILDTEPPVITIESPVECLKTNQASVEVKGKIVDSSSVELKVNGSIISINADGTFTANTGLFEGGNTITVTAEDQAGNTTTLTRSVVKDSTPPQLTILKPIDGSVTNNPLLEIEGSVSDSTNVEVKINDTVVPVVESSFKMSLPILEGLNLVRITAVDQAGNISEEIRTIRLDTQVPVIAVEAPSEGLITNILPVQVRALVTDSTEVTASINSDPVLLSPEGRIEHSINLNEGRQQILITAVDKAGNTASTARNVIIDTQAPVIHLAKPTEGFITNNPQIEVEGTVIDSTVVSLKLNGNDIMLAGSAFSAQITLTEGSNLLTIAAVDQAGNTTTIRREVILNLTPAILVVDKPLNRTFTTQNTIEVSGNSNGNVTINGTGVESDSLGNFTSQADLVEGENEIDVVSSTPAGNSASVKRVVILDTTLPVINLTNPVEGELTNSNLLSVNGSVDELYLKSLSIKVSSLVYPDSVTVYPVSDIDQTVILYEGKNTIMVTAIDSAGNTAELSREITLDTQAPVLTVTSPYNGKKTTLDHVEVKGMVIDSSEVIVRINGTIINNLTFNADLDHTQFSYQLDLTEEVNDILVEAVDPAGNISSVTRTVIYEPVIIPPDPALAAPKIDIALPQPMYDKVNFLIAGDNPVQTGADSASIKPERISVIRGEVKTREGEELPGVKVSVDDHPEYGYTYTRDDGKFDLAINGGGWVDLVFEKEGMLPAYRKVNSNWNEYVFTDSLALVPLDPVVTTITFTDTIETAKSSVVTDEDGIRQAVLLFEKGTEAEMIMPDNSVVKLPSIDVRITEYTVGPNGPMAMPAELPATSGYTYCAEITADEAIAAGAKEVKLSKPVMYYVDNFIEFPIGMPVPVGYFDIRRMAWVPLEDGLVIGIASETNGFADLIVDSTGVVAASSALDSLGFTEAERKRIAELYEPGQSLMRTPINYFGMYDKNCGIMPPEGAEEPEFIEPDDLLYEEKYPNLDIKPPVNIQNQTISKEVGIQGTAFNLHYESDRVLGRKSEIPLSLTNDSIPKGVKRVILEVDVEGNKLRKEFSPVPNLNYEYKWDGKDGYGRVAAGTHDARIKIGYVYNAEYQFPTYMANALRKSFGRTTGLPIPKIKARSEVTLWKESNQKIILVDNKNTGLGGWNLDVQHSLDPISNTLYLGSGQEQAIGSLGRDLQTVVGIKDGYGSYPDNVPAIYADIRHITNIEICPDRTILICENDRGRVLKVGRDGIIRSFAGIQNVGQLGEGIPATQAALNGAYNTKYAPDGNVYILERYKLRKVDKNGRIWTVAGTGEAGFSGDGGSAINAKFNLPRGLAIASDGSIYFADQSYYPFITDHLPMYSTGVIRKISPDGIITTVVGGGNKVVWDPSSVAPTELLFDNINDLDIGPDGDLYFTVDRLFNRCTVLSHSVFKLCRDGKLRRVAGRGGNSPFNGDGIPATQASLESPLGLCFGPDGKLYIADSKHHRIRAINSEGKIETVVGTGNFGYPVIDGLTPLETNINVKDIDFGPDGSLYLCDGDAHGYGKIVRQVSMGIPVKSPDGYTIPANNGLEVYIFDSKGKHLRTEDALTGKVLFRFTYDDKGFLISVTDPDSLISTIERDTSGNPIAIVTPYGERTILSVDSLGYLVSVTNPKGETVEMRYGNGGLLTGVTSPKNNTQGYSYDDTGRLISTLNSEGGSAQITKSVTDNGYSVQTVTTLGLKSTVTTEQLVNDAQKITVTDGTGLKYTRYISPIGQDTVWMPDGTVTASERSYDPRFGIQVPINAKTVVKTPDGLISTQNQYRKVTQMVGQNATGITDSVVVNGKASVSKYDGVNRLATQVSPEGRKSFSFYNSKDQVIKDSIPGLAATTYQYDSYGNVSRTTQAGRSISYTYDEKGRVKTTTDPLNRVTQYFYDDAGRLLKQLSDSGHEVNYTYDDNGNLTSITPPGRDAHIFTYNNNDAVTSYAPPLLPDSTSTVTNYIYNLDGQLTKTVYPDNSFVEVIYDTTGGAQSNGRPKQVISDRGTTTFNYNNLTGNISSVLTPEGNALSYTYDGSLPLSESWSGEVNGSVSVKYNNDFKVVEQSVNGLNPVTMSYDKDGNPLTLGMLKLNYNPLNGLLQTDTVCNVVNTYSYNNIGEVTSFISRYNGVELFKVEYDRDSLSRITELNEVKKGISKKLNYSYDRDGRLTECFRNDTALSKYEYDVNGNRLSYIAANDQLSNDTITALYDTQDRLVKYGSINYLYDSKGTLTQKIKGSDTTSYTYDNLGNLVTVVLPDKARIDYVIDANNRRIGKKINGRFVQRLIYSGELSPIAELGSLGQIVSRFVYGTKQNVPDYILRNDSVYKVITDHLGSVRMVINANNGNVVESIDYDEYGSILIHNIDSTWAGQPLGYAGGLYDNQTKLVRFGARDYDSYTGRWTAKDPIGFEGGDENLYGYCSNDPINSLDITGEGKFSAILIQALVASTLSYAEYIKSKDFKYTSITGAIALAVGFASVSPNPNDPVIHRAIGYAAGTSLSALLSGGANYGTQILKEGYWKNRLQTAVAGAWAGFTYTLGAMMGATDDTAWGTTIASVMAGIYVAGDVYLQNNVFNK